MAFTKAWLVKNVLVNAQACVTLEKPLPVITSPEFFDDAHYVIVKEVSGFSGIGVDCQALNEIFDALAMLQ